MTCFFQYWYEIKSKRPYPTSTSTLYLRISEINSLIRPVLRKTTYTTSNLELLDNLKTLLTILYFDSINFFSKFILDNSPNYKCFQVSV